VRTIVHLSDLHFNLIEEALLSPLIEAVHSIAPDLLAVSGDLTQHADTDEFRAANAFIRQLPGKLIVVPGNHDMSFYNPWRRATQRLKPFRALVTNDPEPFYRDEEIAVLGLNTARISHLRDGRIRDWQVRRIEARMASAPDTVIRVLVTHHPFDLPSVFPNEELVGRGRHYMPRVLRCIDVLLAGHMHVSHAGPTAQRFRIGENSAVFVQAGTALSTRLRTEHNSFQVIRTAPGVIETEQWLAQGHVFEPKERCVFRKEDSGWTPSKRNL
jgi:3',5'-cyclic AMP phosphodiesterase CpdA